MSTLHKRSVAELCPSVRLQARLDELEGTIFAFKPPDTLEFVHCVSRLVKEAERAYDADFCERVQFLLARERHLAVSASDSRPKAVAHELCSVLLEAMLVQLVEGSTNDPLLRRLHVVEVAKRNRPRLH